MKIKKKKNLLQLSLELLPKFTDFLNSDNCIGKIASKSIRINSVFIQIFFYLLKKGIISNKTSNICSFCEIHLQIRIICTVTSEFMYLSTLQITYYYYYQVSMGGSSAMFSMNQLNAGNHHNTVKRRNKAHTSHDKKKMFEEVIICSLFRIFIIIMSAVCFGFL